ncbi:unnamed protein product, partial [Coregonus sp. 'balchen']
MFVCDTNQHDDNTFSSLRIGSAWSDGMCKCAYFIGPLYLFSTIFLLVIISVDHCLSIMIPMWTQNHRTQQWSFFAWVISASSFNPLLYVLMGSGQKKTFQNFILSRIENAL